MGKYDPLRHHLASISNLEWVASFSDIESVLGCALPSSAGEHRTWWANHGGQMVHQKAWMAAGWRVDVIDLGRRRVTFRRSRAGDLISNAPATRRPERPARPECPPDIRRLVEAARRGLNVAVRVEWASVGTATRSADGWRFPQVSNIPAICRFHLVDGGDLRDVVVTVDNLKAFLGAVGASPKHRLGRTPRMLSIAAVLAQADYVEVDIVTGGSAWFIEDGRGRKADLGAREDANVLEASILAEGRRLGVETLSMPI